MTRVRNAKRDANEPGIINGLKNYGCTVVQLSSADNLGIPDLLVALPDGRFVLMEVKMPKGKLRAGQKKFFEMFKESPVFVVNSIDGAIACVESELRHGNKERE
jgi:hypothetical protein